jgi:hypothetical protein
VRLQSERRERERERVGEVFVHPRARSLWVKSIQSGKRVKGRVREKISLSLSLSLSLFLFFLDLLEAVGGKEILESRARSFEKERILDR